MNEDIREMEHVSQTGMVWRDGECLGWKGAEFSGLEEEIYGWSERGSEVSWCERRGSDGGR